MIDPESERLVKVTFQPKPGYKETEKSPFVVATQTHSAIELILSGKLPDTTFISLYLREFTLSYLRTAAKNCGLIFEGNEYKENADPETREATSHAYIVFGSLPNMTKLSEVPALKDGFSRNGMLKAPRTKPEFVARIGEMEIELANIAAGSVTVVPLFFTRVPLFRTIAFFAAAKSLTPTFRLDPKEKESLEKHEEDMHRINKLLEGVDFSPLSD